MGTKLVRIAPYNPRQGFVKQRHTILHPKPMRFIESQGWYEVDDEIAAILSKIPQEERKPGGLRAFMIANDKDHAIKLENELINLSRRNDEDKVGTIDAPIRAAARPGQKSAPTASVRNQTVATAAPQGRARIRASVKPPAAEGDDAGSDEESDETDED